MSEEEPVEVLPAIGVLAELDENIRRKLTAAGEFVALPEGKYLAIQGEHPTMLSIILSGSVSVKSHARGDTVALAQLGKGDTVGEMATIDPRPASANVRTNEAVQVWQMPCGEFDAFLQKDLEVGYAIMRALAKELCRRIRMDTERSLREADQRHTDSYRADY